MPVEKIRSRRLYEQIAEQIEQLILSREFSSGDRLPSETELARDLGVSRPSVREAMIALETAGLIEVRNGNGHFVSRLPSGDLRLPWARAGADVPGPLEQFGARELIEPEVARLAAERITEDEISQLWANVAQQEALVAQDRNGDAEIERFHLLLAAASGNRVYLQVMRHLWLLRSGEMWRTLRMRLVRPEHRTAAISHRRELITALERRDGVAAAGAMCRLLARARARYFDAGPVAAEPQSASRRRFRG